MTYIKFLVVAIIFSITIFNCTTDDGVSPAQEAEKQTDEGWEQFELGAYQEALTKFTEAINTDNQYAEAFIGAGWTSARLAKLNEAVSYFNHSLNLDASKADAHAGLAYVYNAQKEYQAAINSANVALNNNSTWSFSHDKSLNYKDIHLLLAQCYFALNNFNTCLTQVKKINGSFSVDVSTIEGKSELAAEIETLRETT